MKMQGNNKPCRNEDIKMINKHYKVIFINRQLNKKVEITVSGQNKGNAIYNAKCDIEHPYRCPDLYEIGFYKNAEVVSEPEYIKDYAKELAKVLTKDNYTTCPKCEGGRYIPKFIQYNNGICYQCGGLGKVLKGIKSTYIISDLENEVK